VGKLANLNNEKRETSASGTLHWAKVSFPELRLKCSAYYTLVRKLPLKRNITLKRKKVDFVDTSESLQRKIRIVELINLV
jgi:hypothetical protein